MADFASFKHGGVTYPLTTSGTNPILRDLDPAVFYLLEFYASVIETHLGDRFVAEATAGEATQVTSAVAQTLPLNPEPFLTEEHIQFPLLAASRKSATKEYIGQRKRSVDTIEVAYVLPPMTRGEAERLVPFLKGVAMVLDNRTEQGFDPGYTPSLPTGTAGEKAWASERAGIDRIEVIGESYGGYAPAPDLFFPAVVLTILVKERSEAVVTELDAFEGGDVATDLADPVDDSTVETLADYSDFPPPVLVGPISPATGSKEGGTPVSIPCTGLIVGRRYRVLFAGSDASSVRVISTTELQCQTPQVEATPTRAADVLVLDQDNQLSNTLTGAFTFTSP